MNKKIGIISTGSYIPDDKLTNLDLQKVLNTSDEWITERTGIRERRIGNKHESTSLMAAKSAKNAVESAGFNPNDIDIIIVGTSTPDMFFPSTACLVQKELGAKNCVAFDVMAACSGFIFALHTALNFISCGKYGNALVIGAEKMSVAMDWSDRSTCILFGDGAGACLIAETKDGSGIIETNIMSHGEESELLSLPAVGRNYLDSFKIMETNKQYLKMNGKIIFKFAVSNMQKSIQKALSDAGLTASDIDIFIPHQANIRIINSLGKKLGIPNKKVFVNVDKYGNMASASVIVALDEAVRTGRIKKGDCVLLATFGGGLTCGACILKW